MDGRSRRDAATRAIDKILNGELPDALESEALDFKEEKDTVGSGGVRSPIDPHHDASARALTAEVACFANTEHGGVLVVGVDDKQRGPSAFIGTYLDTTWLRKRIYELTTPRFSVDVIEERTVVEKRIYLIDIPPALEEIRVAGDQRLRARVGKECVELTGDMARRFLEARRNYDWSSEPSFYRLSQADRSALDLARTYYEREHGRSPSSDSALVNRLGLFANALDDDPILNNAGALILCSIDPTQMQMDLLVTNVEGQESQKRVEAKAPALVAYHTVIATVLEQFPTFTRVVGTQRRTERAISDRAAREALINALMHRDYRHVNGRIVVSVIGHPATTLKVRSPGGLPPGVTVDRLLTVPSHPRNPVLASAIHTLGLAEREGVGVDTMYTEMLRDGHPSPDIIEDSGDVVCLLRGGTPDLHIRTFFDDLTARHKYLGADVRTHLAITLLLSTTPLRPEELATAAQCTVAEASTTLVGLAAVGVLTRLVNGSKSFRLEPGVADRLHSRLQYSPRTSAEVQWETVRAYFDVTPEISSPNVAALLNLHPVRASALLSSFARLGLIAPVGKPRGRGVRYRLMANS